MAEPFLYMDIVKVLDYGGREVQAWEISEMNAQELTMDGFGDWIIVPDASNVITVTLEVFGDCWGKVQTTTDRLSNLVLFEIPMIAVDWPAGELEEADTPYTDFTMPVTAFRMVMGGSAKVPPGGGVPSVRMTARAQ